MSLLRRLVHHASGPSHVDPSTSDRGQILVIVAAGFLIMVAMVGLVIDGGHAWGRQRQTQNAADAAAEAGAIVLAQRLANVSPTKTDAHVNAAVNAAFDASQASRQAAYYTDITAAMIDGSGAVTTNTASAAQVGGGSIPTNAAGVRAIGTQTFDTFLARVMGFTQFTTTAPATAVAGYISQVCSAAAGCDVMPVTVPVTVLGCDGSNNPAPVQPATDWSVSSQPLTVPLCKNGPGNVGWLDWTPTAGGTSELVDQINTPNNPAIDLPSWQYITATGNINAATVENALNARSGQIVLFPMFDSTCDATPSGPLVTDCPTGHVGGNGSNQWYHLPQFTAFQFCGPAIPECAAAGLTQGAYISGSNPICDTGNGATSCLAGRFLNIITKGTVGPASGVNPGTNLIGVQLFE